ncbi:dihydrolipoamide acetyltransferase family protein [Amycolatopsis rhabdoformis]|uniref:Dihydrolipoamide acetyltransferase component of pyruvate dehydrogenase complex n=1 Tax=Amycolatopsis rhabdoformis TaxID=1448059 RepID=A0ABZ1IEJ6_9PSEU|nr:dihydrolipoamide acetyltransferase family protein [Amycolatopsis rhabdoformis]WSE31870.1 dihydrolipoamide acetyltransferase family protein [Amycolatopsis rhabdoformis]
MATLLRVPEVATGSTEAVLSEWLVPENEAFDAGTALAVLETDKAAVEVEAETGATVLRQLVDRGTTVAVGTPIAVLGAVGEDVSGLLAEVGVPASRNGQAASEVAASEVVGGAAAVQGSAPAATAVPNGSGGRIFASPLARKLLKDAGLGLEEVTGTGPNGRIVRKDVEAAIARASAAPQSVVQAAVPPEPEVLAEPATTPARREPVLGASFTEVPHTRIRRAIASRLTMSKQTVPHFSVRRAARIDALLALRKQLNEVSPARISVNDLIIRAVAVAHTEVPDANVTWTEDALRKYDSVDVGVAIASERGLVTPVVRGVEKLAPSAISGQVKGFAAQADEGRLKQQDLEGGSIAVSNLGMFGVDEFTAIINPPQAAILAVGAGKPGAVVVDGELTVATELALTLAVDHRAIDGALAAQWLGVLVDALEKPLRLLA